MTANEPEMTTYEQLDAAYFDTAAARLCQASVAGHPEVCEAISSHETEKGRATELLAAVIRLSANLVAAVAEATGRDPQNMAGGIVLRADAQFEGLADIIRITEGDPTP